MVKAVSSIPVSIRPDSFTEPSISELTAGDVIRMYHNQEAKRKRDEGEYKERDVLLSFRSAPDGLLGILDYVAEVSGQRKSVVTKCLSLHAMSWYQGLSQVRLCSRAYQVLHNKSSYPDLWRRMERDDYEFIYPRGVTNNKMFVRTVAYVLGYFNDLSDYLGVPAYKLLLSGLCWSVSTNTEHWSDGVVEKFLVPERDRMLSYLNERVVSFVGISTVMGLREGVIQIEDCITDLQKLVGSDKC